MALNNSGSPVPTMGDGLQECNKIATAIFSVKINKTPVPQFIKFFLNPVRKSIRISIK